MLEKLKDILLKTPKNRLLYFGRVGSLLERVFASYEATTSCQNLGTSSGIRAFMEGRGSFLNHLEEDMKNSDIIILWGSSGYELKEILEDKITIVIDPIKTKVAQEANLFLQIRPHGDLELALLFSRFLYLEDSYDKEFASKWASELEEFYELTQSIRIKPTLEKIGITLGQIGDVLELLHNKSVSIVVGSGVQKYRDSVDIVRAIDAFALLIGVFSKDGSGVYHMGGDAKSSGVPKVDIDFSKYDTIFIDSSNPLNQLPNTKRVRELLGSVESVIYYGDRQNATSELAGLVIPKSSIDEETLATFLQDIFNVKIDLVSTNNQKESLYSDGFDTDDGSFCFLDELSINDAPLDTKLYLITPKNRTNSTQRCVYLNASLGFRDGEMVEVISDDGSLRLEVKIDNDLRGDVAMIYSCIDGINELTSHKRSFGSDGAIFQENRVEIKR